MEDVYKKNYYEVQNKDNKVVKNLYNVIQEDDIKDENNLLVAKEKVKKKTQEEKAFVKV